VGDLVQGNIVDAKAPDKVFDIVNMFLMGLGGKEGFEKPLAIMDLTNLSHLCEGGDALSHDWDFPGAVMNLLNGNWGCASSVNDTLVVSDRNKGVTLIKHTPVFFNQSCKMLVFLRLQVGQVEFLEALAMFGLRIHVIENRVVLVKGGGTIFLLP
jgi:hypothetical protein